IDTDRGVCTVTWRGQVAVDGPAQPGRVVLAIEEGGRRLTWAMVAQLAGLPVAGASPIDSTPLPQARPRMETLPFRLADPAREGPQTPIATAAAADDEPQHTPRALTHAPMTLLMPGAIEQVSPPGETLGQTLVADAIDRATPLVDVNVSRPEVRVPPPADRAFE